MEKSVTETLGSKAILDMEKSIYLPKDSNAYYFMT